MNIRIFDVYILLLATPKTIVLGDKNDFCNYIFALVCDINQIIKRNNQIIKTNSHIPGFSLGLDDMEGDLSPHMGGQVQGDKAVIGGMDGEGHILYGGTHTSNSF